MAIISPISYSYLTHTSASLPISFCYNSSSTFALSPKPTQSTKHKKAKGHQVSKVCCNSKKKNASTPNPEEGKASQNIIGKRRDVLIGLGGIYSAATLSNKNNPLAIAAPISPPDLTTCGPPNLPSDLKPINCCPPFLQSEKPIDFKTEKFDVYINAVTGSSNAEFAGNFMNLVQVQNPRTQMISSNLRLAITDFLDDLEAENGDSILVTLIPRLGIGLVTIKDIKIDFTAE